jgi:hypothetical protein
MPRWPAMLAVLCALAPLGVSSAHEVRPAMLDIRQLAPSGYSIVWKRPALGDISTHLSPRLSNGWLDPPPRDQYSSGSFLIERWSVTDAPARALDQANLRIEGLQGTLIDVLVRVTFLDGRRIEAIVRPEHPIFAFDIAQANGADRWQFMRLGMQHILTGPDHLLFVLGLLLIAQGGWLLVRAISGFTVAHSITLAIATLWRIDLPVSLLNMLVALSIVFLALELMRSRRGGTSLSLREPMIPAFAFGLLHGLAFATALATLDFEGVDLFRALLQFNVGVEIGQLAFVGAVITLVQVLRLKKIEWPQAVALAPVYAIGIAGAAWMYQCGAAVLAGQ